MHRLVGHLDVQRVGIGVGIDRDRRDAHLARGLDDAAGDFAAIGDQDLTEHAPHSTPSLVLRRNAKKVNSPTGLKRNTVVVQAA